MHYQLCLLYQKHAYRFHALSFQRTEEKKGEFIRLVFFSDVLVKAHLFRISNHYISLNQNLNPYVLFFLQQVRTSYFSRFI